MSKERQSYYKLPDKKPPLRCCKSKKFIDKIMFLGCVARSRFNETRNEIFDKSWVFSLLCMKSLQKGVAKITMMVLC